MFISWGVQGLGFSRVRVFKGLGFKGEDVKGLGCSRLRSFKG